MSDAPDVLIRRAEPADAEKVAAVYLASFGARYDFPLAHTPDEVRGWVADQLLPTTETWAAVSHEELVGFLSLGEAFVEQLYLAPAWTGRGVGSRLIELAKQRRPAGLDLYTFQINDGARRFYERHGFAAVWFGDGSENEEGQPDVRYAWRSGEDAAVRSTHGATERFPRPGDDPARAEGAPARSPRRRAAPNDGDRARVEGRLPGAADDRSR